MNKQEYVSHCYQQLVSVFQQAKHFKKDKKQKYRVEGFIHAGKLLGVISHEEAISLMEKSHFEVYAESINERQQRKASLKEAVAIGDDDFINIPAYERLKL